MTLYWRWRDSWSFDFEYGVEIVCETEDDSWRNTKIHFLMIVYIIRQVAGTPGNLFGASHNNRRCKHSPRTGCWQWHSQIHWAAHIFWSSSIYWFADPRAWWHAVCHCGTLWPAIERHCCRRCRFLRPLIDIMDDRSSTTTANLRHHHSAILSIVQVWWLYQEASFIRSVFALRAPLVHRSAKQHSILASSRIFWTRWPRWRTLLSVNGHNNPCSMKTVAGRGRGQGDWKGKFMLIKSRNLEHDRVMH